MIDLRDWQRKLHAWCIAKYGPQTLERRGLVMGEELGEVQAAILKRAEGEPSKKGHDIQDELPQLLIGLLVTAECVGLDMETALEQAFAKVNLPVRGCYTCAHYTRSAGPASTHPCRLPCAGGSSRPATVWLRACFTPGLHQDDCMVYAKDNPCPEWKSWK